MQTYPRKLQLSRNRWFYRTTMKTAQLPQAVRYSLEVTTHQRQHKFGRSQLDLV